MVWELNKTGVGWGGRERRPAPHQGKCPAGGSHDGAGSFDYCMAFGRRVREEATGVAG